MAIDRQTAEKFLNDKVGCVYRDSDRDVYVVGFLESLTESSILLRSKDRLFAISLLHIILLKGVD